MERTSKVYQTYIDILKKELVPAMGCTEPIALAYCAAKARDVLGFVPTKASIKVSGNIIKNVKSVVVPNSGGMRGIETAAAVGIFYGKPELELEVISRVTEDEANSLSSRMNEIDFNVSALDSNRVLDIIIELEGNGHSSCVRICDEHTNIVSIMRDGECLWAKDSDCSCEYEQDQLDYGLLNMEDIFDFAQTAELCDVREIIDRQINYNLAIAKEGMANNYGARIGQILAKRDNSPKTRAKAMAAAGSDARMGGCDMPVIINSGSGNQGMTTSLPVIVYADYFGKTHDELIRALLMSNLVTLHLKKGIGRLSAYCGAVSAGASAGAGIAYLLTEDLRTINHTLVNALAITSGIVCDGAKASCAAKIAMAVDAGILGYEMFCEGCQFYRGDGLVGQGVEKTIENISALGHDGMKETDTKIIEIMINC